MRRAARVTAIVLLGLLAALATAIGWLHSQRPFTALPRDPADAIPVERERRVERWRDRILLHVELAGGEPIGPVRFVVSLPDPLPARPVPLLVILGGLGRGAGVVREITLAGGDPGANAIASLDWPVPSRDPGIPELIAQAASYRAAALSVPGRVDRILRWAVRQPWLDGDRQSLLGFSLGAFVVPAVHWLVEQRGGGVRATVLAYAGAPIGAVVAGHSQVRPRWAAPILGAATDLLLRPLEPSAYLPRLHGRFLVLGGKDDRLIAPEAAARLRALTPAPRTVVLLEGAHMGVGPGRRALLREVIATTRAWLVAEGALDEGRDARSRPAR